MNFEEVKENVVLNGGNVNGFIPAGGINAMAPYLSFYVKGLNTKYVVFWISAQSTASVRFNFSVRIINAGRNNRNVKNYCRQNGWNMPREHYEKREETMFRNVLINTRQDLINILNNMKTHYGSMLNQLDKFLTRGW